MALQPSNENVDMFLEMVGHAMSRDVAIRRLKGNNNNVEQALNEFFEDPSSETKYSWDDSAFNQDREGGGNNHGISFNIQGADDLGPNAQGRFDGALSRPPSRTSNNRSPIGKVIDLTPEHAMADPRMSMSSQDQQDRELQQALALSLQDAGLPPQEEGVTGGTGVEEVHFGPANRTNYESGQWEMVPVGKSAVQEIMVDPEPSERKRDLDAPAFLKPTIKDNRLNFLITVYHEIPMIRNIFLNTTDLLPNYGHDKEWWAGQRIMFPSIHDDDDPPTYDEVDRELQRLMAFLDRTERAYGSVDVLANLDEVKRFVRQQGPDVESAVLNCWKNIFEDTVHRGMTRTVFSAGVASAASEERPQEFAMLELTPPPKDSVQETLYDIADEVMWPGIGNLDLSEAPYLSHIAEVIAFRVEGGVEHKRVDIPAIWYPDRYLKSSREAALEMRKKKRATADRLERIVKLESQLMYAPLRTGRVVAVKDLYAASLKHDEAVLKQNGVRPEDEMMDAGEGPSRAAAKLSDELAKVMDSINKKLISLSEAKEKAIEELRNLSKLYTEPSDDPSAPKLRKYSLRGVSTKKDTMYICRRAEPDLIDMDLDSENSEPKNLDQWWKIHYAQFGHSPVSVEKITEKEVLKAARDDSNATMLVYASEKALNFQKHALPKVLENFVRWDNAAFKAEFPESQSEIDTQSPIQSLDSQSVSSLGIGPSSPGKRKYDEEDPNGRLSARRVGAISTAGPTPTVVVKERELRGSDESGSSNGSSSNTLQGLGGMSMTTEPEHTIIGVDPALMNNVEMQERGGMSLLGRAQAQSRVLGEATGTSLGTGLGTIDEMDMDMDLDQVVQRDADVMEESLAVKRVGFVE